MSKALSIFFFFTLFVAITLTAAYWVYQHGGLKQYLSVADAIDTLPASEQAQTREQFYSSGDSDLYGGTLMWVNTKRNGGVWVWGEKGPKYFRANDDSVFSYWRACGPEVVGPDAPKRIFQLPRSVDEDIRTWQGRVRQGDWTTIAITEGTAGTLREAFAYDKWLFMPRQTPCTK